MGGKAVPTMNPYLALLLLGAALILAPLLSIVSVNVLFGLGIPINIGTWGASFWLTQLIWGQSKK